MRPISPDPARGGGVLAASGCVDPVRTPPPTWAAQRPPEVRPPLDISAMATGYAASWARLELTAWLAVDLPDGELFDDLVLVAYEVLANTVEHAYTHSPDGAGPVRLLARRSQDAIHITVADHGVWRVGAGPSALDGFRGQGLSLVRLLMPDVHVETTATGTVVHLRSPAPPPATIRHRPAGPSI